MKSFLKEIESKFQELQEKESKPDFLDLDNDDNTKEPMKQAAKQAKAKKKIEDVKNPGKYKTGMKIGYDKDGDGVPNKADADPEDGSVTEADIVVTDPSKIKDVEGEIGVNDRIVVEDDLEEISATGGVAPFTTKYAFSTRAQAKKKKKMKYDSVQQAMDAKYAALIESYSKFASGNPKSTPSQTVNGTIKEVAKKLQEIEQLVRYTSRLKNESGIAGSTYGKSTHNALHKISERLLKISERVRSLGE